MIALVEGAQRQKTPNEIALTILLSALTIIFLLAVVALQPMAGYSGAQQSLVVLTALLVCLIPTTIGALLSAIGIAGMDRLVQRNVLATSGPGRRGRGRRRHPAARQDRHDHLRQPAGHRADPGARRAGGGPRRGGPAVQPGRPDAGGSQHRRAVRGATMICRRRRRRTRRPPSSSPFTAQTRMSGLGSRRARGPQGRRLRRRRMGATAAAGAPAARPTVGGDRRPTIGEQGGDAAGRRRADAGGGAARCSASSSCPTWSSPAWPSGSREMRAMGIRTVMITGDNPLTAKAIAARPAWTTTSPRPRPRTRWP